MTTLDLEALPKELIAHIACCSDALSVLRLSQTCRTIRSVVYDTLVFKNILLGSQRHRWKHASLDMGAIETRASNDVATLARYAVADELTWELSQKECPLEHPQRFVNYLPELFIVRHPFIKAQCWKRFLRKPLEQIPSQVFCLATAILSSEEDMPQVHRSLRMQDTPFLQRQDSTKAYLWTLCSVALTLRSSLKRRRDVWPYNTAALVPDVALPRLQHIPLLPMNDRYSIPVPFSRRAVELLGRSTSSFSNWDSWYDMHNYAAFSSASYLFDSEWCGYYVGFGVQEGLVDPPMTEIRFQSGGPLPRNEESASPEVESVRVEALNCVDGIDRFNINGTMSHRDRVIELIGRKAYRNGPRWDWELRLSPFGLVGFWGIKNADEDRLHRYGIVWLWKKDWTQSS